MTWRLPWWGHLFIVLVAALFIALMLSFAFWSALTDHFFAAFGFVAIAGQIGFLIETERRIKAERAQDADTLRVMKGVQAMIEAACDRTRANIDYIRACESAQEAGQPLPEPPQQIADAGFPVPPRGRLH